MKIGVETLKAKVALLPLHPGVYRMLDKEGKVLYVGKAKSLKKRVVSYTHYDKLPVRLQRMVVQVADLLVVETESEAEAFLLENELIKKYKPPFNILLKDDKSFPYIMLLDSLHTGYPRVTKYRGVRLNKADYFGPYADGSAVFESLNTLQKVFGLRSCTDSSFLHRTRPCLLYQIKKCSGACVGLISQEDYAKQVQDAKDFLMGKNTDIQKRLNQEMQEKSRLQEYEKALILRDKIIALNKMQLAGENLLKTSFDADFVALYREGQNAVIEIFFFRNGKNGGTHRVFLKDLDEQTNEHILTSFLGQFYRDISIPHEIIVSEKKIDKKAIEVAFSKISNHLVRISSSVREVRQKLLERAIKNAKEALQRFLQENGEQKKQLADLAKLMKIDKIENVEVYDNSHIQGTSAVGVCISANETGFNKSQYKRFNIKKAQTNDDFDMMREVLERRLLRGKQENNLPSAFIIDGGKGQLSSVREMMIKTGIYVPTLGVAKGEERNAGNEKLYLLDSKEAIILEHNSSLLYFIQRLRDEAHRFAIGSHRLKRAKETKNTALDSIEGIGVKRRQKLIAYFGSPKAVLDAGITELQQVEGISFNIAQKIYALTHPSH